jgi:hypothetical protein
MRRFSPAAMQCSVGLLQFVVVPLLGIPLFSSDLLLTIVIATRNNVAAISLPLRKAAVTGPIPEAN